MSEDKAYLSWPEAKVGDRIVVAEMLGNPLSGQWLKCNEAVRRCVQAQATNIPQGSREDIVQDVMERVRKSLPTFEYRCALRAWVFSIVHNCVIDVYRNIKRDNIHISYLKDYYADSEHECNTIDIIDPETVEDTCIALENLKEAREALQEYIAAHAKSGRNTRILSMVLDEGHSLEETAMAVGCSAPVVGYVVRSARRYVRERLKQES